MNPPFFWMKSCFLLKLLKNCYPKNGFCCEISRINPQKEAKTTKDLTLLLVPLFA